MLSEELASFPRLVKYFNKFGSIDKPCKQRQMIQLEKIEKFLKAQKTKLDNHLKLYNNRPYPNTAFSYGKFHMTLSVLIVYNKEIDQKVGETEEDHIGQLIVLVNEAALAISHNDKLVLDIDKFTNYLINKVKYEKEFRKLRHMQRSIVAKINFLGSKQKQQNYASMLAVEFIQANQRYQKEFAYSPPSVFDDILYEYIRHNPVLSKMIQPTAETIAKADVEAAIYTVSQVALQVYNALNIDEKGYSRKIVYISLIRLLFNEAYSIESELSKYPNTDAYFLVKCEEFSNQRVRDLGLTEEITNCYTPGLGIQSLFKSKQFDMLKNLELMTNPIDIMKHVHTVLMSITKCFGGGKTLSFDDTFTILLALMSLSPPANAFSIAKFCLKWNDIQISKIVGMSKNYFIAAVEHLIALSEEEEEISEEEAKEKKK